MAVDSHFEVKIYSAMIFANIIDFVTKGVFGYWARHKYATSREQAQRRKLMVRKTTYDQKNKLMIRKTSS